MSCTASDLWTAGCSAATDHPTPPQTHKHSVSEDDQKTTKKTTKNNTLFIQGESAAAFSDYAFLVKYKIDGKNMNYFGVSFAAQSLEFNSSVFIDIHL